MRIYSVINMDLVKSRELENRIEVQSNLERYFKDLNRKYNDILVAPITFTLGDEWQIVIRDIKESYSIFVEIKKFLKCLNVKAYCGIGVGTISTNEAKDTRRMDGEAFIYARDAIRIAKKSNTFYNEVIHTSDSKLVLMGKDIQINNPDSVGYLEIIDECAITSEDNSMEIGFIEVINNIMQNNEMIENKFTQKQLEIISLYEQLGSYSNIEKKYPKYKKSNISNKLSAANYFLTVYNKRIIKSLLYAYQKRLEEVFGKEYSFSDACRR